MKISAVEEYGLRCLVQLARSDAQAEGSVAISELARREGLSVPYVGKLMGLLKRAGLVTSARGQQGGYTLARPAAEIGLQEAVRALAEPIYHKGFCKEHSGSQDICVHVRDCGLRAVWREVQAAVDAVFARVRLSDLIEAERPLTTRLRGSRGWPAGQAPAAPAGARLAEPELTHACVACASCDDAPDAPAALTISYPPPREALS